MRVEMEWGSGKCYKEKDSANIIHQTPLKVSSFHFN